MKPTITLIEDWLIDESRTLLTHLLPNIDYATGPGEWDGEYLKEIIPKMPAVRVAFLGGDVENNSYLTLASEWTLIIAVGWNCENEDDRRRGDEGLYALVEILATGLHNELVTREQKKLGRIRVAGWNNIWSGDFNRSRISVHELGFEMPAPLNYERQTLLDDFLRAGVEYDLKGGSDVDASEVIELRQTE